MTKLLMLVTLFAVGFMGTQQPALAISADTPLMILKKPRPSSQGCAESAGKTLLRVTFGSTGTIEDVEVKTGSGCSAFDGSAVDAARSIEFTPATKDGQPITVAKSIEYEFVRY